MTINLFSVKINNTYDYIQNTVPSGTGTWLVSNDLTGYNAGESYNVASGVPARINLALDYKINKAIYPTIENVCEYLNNYFYSPRNLDSVYQFDLTVFERFPLTIEDQRIYNNYLSNWGNYTFASGSLEVTDYVFQTGDLIQVRNALRNKFVSYATVSSETVTLDNSAFIDTTENALLMLMNIPTSVQDVISQMIHFDFYVRDGHTDLTSESVGNYSYSKDLLPVGGLGYPASLVRSLDAHKVVRFN
jgi:hypothetical protein